MSKWFLFLLFSVGLNAVNIFAMLLLPNEALHPTLELNPGLLFEYNGQLYAIQYLLTPERLPMMEELIMQYPVIIHRAIKRNLVDVVRFAAENCHGHWTVNPLDLFHNPTFSSLRSALALKQSTQIPQQFWIASLRSQRRFDRL